MLSCRRPRPCCFPPPAATAGHKQCAAPAPAPARARGAGPGGTVLKVGSIDGPMQIVTSRMCSWKQCSRQLNCSRHRQQTGSQRARVRTCEAVMSLSSASCGREVAAPEPHARTHARTAATDGITWATAPMFAPTSRRNVGIRHATMPRLFPATRHWVGGAPQGRVCQACPARPAAACQARRARTTASPAPRPRCRMRYLLRLRQWNILGRLLPAAHSALLG